MTQSPRFMGALTALVTPFQADGSLDLNAFRQLIDKQVAAGIDGLVVCGSTGEAHTLSVDERVELVRVCVEQVKGRMPVIAGAGSSSTQTACDLQKQMKAVGADATLHVMPWYNKPTQEGLYQHFAAIARAADLPLIMYNVPSRTCCDISADTVLRLAKEFSNIVGLKECNLEPLRLQSLLGDLKILRADFAVFTGEDGFVLPLLAMGGHGVISVFGNLAPKMAIELIQAFRQNDFETAQTLAGRLAALTSLMFFRSNPIPVKSALYLRGDVQNVFRLPLCPLNSDDMTYLKTELSKQGWL